MTHLLVDFGEKSFCNFLKTSKIKLQKIPNSRLRAPLQNTWVLGFRFISLSHDVIEKNTVTSKRFCGSDCDYNEPISHPRTIGACFVCDDSISAQWNHAADGRLLKKSSALTSNDRRYPWGSLNCEICLSIPTAIIWVNLSVDYFQAEVAASLDFTPSFSSFVFAWKGLDIMREARVGLPSSSIGSRTNFLVASTIRTLMGRNALLSLHR